MKYELVKWYPSLGSRFEEGDIVTHRGNMYSKGTCHVCIPEVENNPDFWREIEEKDYEILSYKDLHTKGVIYPREYNRYSQRVKDTYSIYSVKRLSDGEVFAIGDAVESIKTSAKCIIKYFELKGNLCWLQGGDTVFLMNARHVRKPLFITIDGVDIYEGDDCYFIEKNRSNDFITPTRGRDGKHDFSRFLYFSTKEKAEEYIKSKKKSFLFTTKDGVDIYTGDSYWYVGRHYNIGYRDEAKQHIIDSYDTYFSSEEKAKEYRDNKEPIYSKDDIREAIKHARVAYVADSESFIFQTALERNLKL